MKRYIFTFLYIITLIGAPFAFGQTPPTQAPITGEYTVLAPLPGTTKGNCTGTDCKADINSYLGGLFGLAIGIGAVIAMILLGFYGFQYAMSDSASVKMANKDKLWEIVQGLLLLISAYAIIYTINPDLLAFNLEITSPKTFAPTTTATSSVPYGSSAIGPGSEVAVRTALSGIGINAGACSPNQTRGCTNVAGLPQVAIDGLLGLKSACNCDFTITGGTEGGHETHGPGKSIIDLSPTSSLNTYLGASNPREAQVVTISVNGRTLRFKYETKGGNAGGTSTGNHWHVVVN